MSGGSGHGREDAAAWRHVLLALDYRYGEVEPWENPQVFKGPQDTGLHRLRVANS